MGNGYLAICLLLILIAFAVLALRSRMVARRYEAELRCERTRAHFGATRHQLFMLGVNGAVDMDAPAFATLFFLHTFVMRRNDQYPKISGVLLGQFGRDDERRTVDKSFHAPPLKPVLIDTAAGIDMLIRDHSRLFRFLHALESRSGIVSVLAKILAPKIQRHEARRHPEVVQLQEARREVLSLYHHNNTPAPAHC